MNFFVDSIILFLQSPQLLFAVQSISCLVKIYFLCFLLLKAIRSYSVPRSFFFLISVLLCGLIVDFSWIVKFSKEFFFPSIDYRVVIFFIRIAWAFNLIQFQSLGLFIESLGERKFKLKKHQIVFSVLNCLPIGYFLYVAFFNSIELHQRPELELTLMSYSSMYFFLILVLPSLFLTFKRLRSTDFPKILKRQLSLLIKYLISAYLVSEFIQGVFINENETIYAVTTISTIILTCAIFYCTRTIMGLRFLNFQSHVQAHHAFNFIDDFKNLLEQLSHITSYKELRHITQTFFRDAFSIVPNRTVLYFRRLDASTHKEEDYVYQQSIIEAMVENFIIRHSNEDCKIYEQIQKNKILITDEIAFSSFYEDDPNHKETLHFLESINADIFLPIFEKRMIVAYIIIERDARINNFYSNIERDEMLVFASYLGNIINLLQNRNLNSLIQKEKEMREELYNKHQEINQYKESLRSFLRDSKHRKIGIIFYKNRRFIFGNKEAKELIDVNINALEGHPVTKDLRRLAQQVEEYKSSQTAFVKDSKGNRLVIAGLPNLEQNNVIITVCYPEVSDIIKQQIDYLDNPSEWDYLLYLETTKSGQLINQLIPGSGTQLLKFKIDLLKLALSKKALLLELPEDDLRPTVEILHHISLRSQLHTLHLSASIPASDLAPKLFGINPIFGIDQKEPPLMERLDGIGTLYIENVHLLDLEMQDYLADFIKFGYYHPYKSDQRFASNVRIICSTGQQLLSLVQNGKFSRKLFNELKQTTLSMPMLYNLTSQEMSELAEGFGEQVLISPDFKNLLELTDKEKDRILNIRPVSLQELKNRVQHQLIQKSQKNNIYQETKFDPAYNITDPELVQAARLGKAALRDQKVMSILWNKFKNQNKIATFLGVNRSSVNRRCKEFNLE